MAALAAIADGVDESDARRAAASCQQAHASRLVGSRVADRDHFVAFLAGGQPDDPLVADPRTDERPSKGCAPADPSRPRRPPRRRRRWSASRRLSSSSASSTVAPKRTWSRDGLSGRIDDLRCFHDPREMR